MRPTPRKFLNADRWGYGLFWTWNLIFVAFMILGFVPRMLPSLLQAVSEGIVPVIFLISGIALSTVPILAVILGLTVLRRSPRKLFALGYVVEGPLMLLLAVRLFLIRQATPALTLLIVVAGLGMAAFLWHLLDSESPRGGRLGGLLRLAGLTLILLASLYISVWIFFYALPIGTQVLKWLWGILGNLPRFLHDLWSAIRDMFIYQLVWVPFYLLGLILLLFTATLFVLTPIAVPVLTVRTWWRDLRQQARQSGWVIPILLTAVIAVVCAAAFVVTNRQPQKLAFDLLEAPPTSLEQAAALRQREKDLRMGLLNAYLAPFRYISAMGEVRHISDLYEQVFRLPLKSARSVQNLYENVARPLLYDPVHPQKTLNRQDNTALTQEPQEAAQLYQRYFDKTIVEGERHTIVNAVRSTWSRDQAEAAWQAVDEREVYLVRQEVTIQEHNDWADVELYEVYQNKTYQQQEVIYYFNLPESAVITGLWLGNSPDRDKRFVYQVAPRGAAQTIYRNETHIQRDPALVEQIGPRQYRLRAFPVPPATINYDGTGAVGTPKPAQPLYLWLTYQVLADGDTWPMPHLAVRRNVYWDPKTVRLVNGAQMKTTAEAWLPDALSAVQPVSPGAHRVDLEGGDTVLVVPASQTSLPAFPANLRLAVVLDRSYSMSAHASQVSLALGQLQGIYEAGAAVDIYQTASPYRGESPTLISLRTLDRQAIIYQGGHNPAELLAQFESLRANRTYDAVLVLTDGTGYELGANPVQVPIPDAPVWMVHLGGDIPLGYDDQTLQAIQASGGGVVGDLDQALTRLSMALTPGTAGVQGDMVDGYLWSVLSTSQADAAASGVLVHNAEDGFAALAARRLILAEIQRQRGTLSELDTLDRLHALAQKYSLLTPYSSLIVLVNEQQKQQLKEEEAKTDRFQREVEAVGETTPPQPVPLTGVPEPEEWLLLGASLLVLVWYTASQRAARSG